MVQNMPKRRLAGLGMALAAGALVPALLGGCRGDRSDKPPREFLPDMDDQPRWNPQTKSEFFPDGRTMRTPVVGTVAFGRRSTIAPPGDEPWKRINRAQREELLAADPRVSLGLTQDMDPREAWSVSAPGLFVQTIPVPVDMELLKRGQERFNIYCSVCHGFSGEGGGIVAEGSQAGSLYGGMVGRRWSYTVPSFHDPKYQTTSSERTGRDGYLFYTAMYGVEFGGKMPGYAHALSTRDAWAVVAYIRALQQAQAGSLADVPEEQRRVLERQRGGIALRDQHTDSTGGAP